jgi:hypothetical protein
VAKRKREKSKAEVVGFLGVGLDNRDEHRRITRSEHFLLIGGSSETHERMQDTAIHFDESLQRRGKALCDLSPQEALELLHDALEQ